MKTFIFSALALGMMASCSNTEVEGIDVVDNGEPVAIQVTAGVKTNVVAGVTRAPITGDATFKATVLAWEAATPNFATDPTWQVGTSDIKASGETPTLTLDENKYYLADGTSTSMKAFYVENATVDDAHKYIYNFANTDGQKDVLITADAVSGTKASTTPVKFAFTHPLMQLKFKLIAGKGFPNGKTITNLKVNGVKLPIGVDMSTSTVLYSTVTQNIGVPESDNKVIDGNIVGNPIMVAPISKGEFTIDVSANGKDYKGIPVNLNGISESVSGAGVAYTVELTFHEKMSASATVSDWADNGTGSGTVE